MSGRGRKLVDAGGPQGDHKGTTRGPQGDHMGPHGDHKEATRGEEKDLRISQRKAPMGS